MQQVLLTMLLMELCIAVWRCRIWHQFVYTRWWLESNHRSLMHSAEIMARKSTRPRNQRHHVWHMRKVRLMDKILHQFMHKVGNFALRLAIPAVLKHVLTISTGGGWCCPSTVCMLCIICLLSLMPKWLSKWSWLKINVFFSGYEKSDEDHITPYMAAYVLVYKRSGVYSVYMILPIRVCQGYLPPFTKTKIIIDNMIEPHKNVKTSDHHRQF